MSYPVPERPDINQLRRQAKELRDAARQGDPDALERFARHRPSTRRPSAGQGEVTLAAAQLVVARRAGLLQLAQAKSRYRRRRGFAARGLRVIDRLREGP